MLCLASELDPVGRHTVLMSHSTRIVGVIAILVTRIMTLTYNYCYDQDYSDTDSDSDFDTDTDTDTTDSWQHRRRIIVKTIVDRFVSSIIIGHELKAS